MFIKAGWGFNVGQDFARTVIDTPIDVAPKEYAKLGYVIGYIAADPASSLGFLRGFGGKPVRVHVRKDALNEG